MKRTDRSAATLDERTGGLGTGTMLELMAMFRRESATEFVRCGSRRRLRGFEVEERQLTALDMSLVQLFERTELVAPAVEGWRHSEVLQKSSRTSNALQERQEKNHGRCL